MTRVQAIARALRGGCVIQGQTRVRDVHGESRSIGTIPAFLLATAHPDARQFLSERGESFGKINPSGAADQKTREAWSNVINGKRGGDDGSAQRKVLQGPTQDGAA